MSGTLVWNGQETVRRTTSILGNGERRTTSKTANVLLCDFSSSMSDPIGRGDNRHKADGVKEAVSNFIANLPASAYLSIIVFSSTAQAVFRMQPIGQKKLDAIQIIQSFNPAGTTAMEEAFILGEEELQASPANYLARIYGLTDGIPDSDPTLVAERLKKRNVQISTVGYGSGSAIDEDLLRCLASVSSTTGNPLYYHFLDSKSLSGFLKRESSHYTV